MRKHIKLIISLVLTCTILVVLYSMVDVDTLGSVIAKGDPFWLAVYLLLFVPQIIMGGLRWQMVVEYFGDTRLGYGLATSHFLGACSANLIIPSKLGELVKGTWIKTGDRKFLPFFLVVLEKIFDILAVLAILTVALAVVVLDPQYQPRSVLVPILGVLIVCWVIGLWLLRGTLLVRLVNRYVLKGDEAETVARWKSITSARGKLARVCGLTVVLWLVQLLQFWGMFKIFGVAVELDELFAGSALGLLAGAMPLTTGGVGTRDAALLWYFGSSITMEIVLSVGILSFLRILLVGLVGIPFFFVRMREGKDGK